MTEVSSDRIEPLLHHTDKAIFDAEVLLCWRGTIPDHAFEVIDDQGNVLASGLPRDRDARRAASSQAAAIPAATPARLPAHVPIAASSQQFAPVAIPSRAMPQLVPAEAVNLPPQHWLQPRVVGEPQAKPRPRVKQPPPDFVEPQEPPVPAVSQPRVQPPPPDGVQPRIKSPPPEFLQPQVKPLPPFKPPPQVKPPPAFKPPPPAVDQPQAKPPFPDVGQPQVALQLEAHAEMQQRAEIQQQAERQQRAERQQAEMEHRMELHEAEAMRRQLTMQFVELEMHAQMVRDQRLLVEQERMLNEERQAHAEMELHDAHTEMELHEVHVEMELHEAQAKIKRAELQEKLEHQMKQREAQAAMEQKMEAVRAQHEEAAAARHDELVMWHAKLEARDRERQQAEQKEEEASRMRRAGEKRKQESASTEFGPQAAEERQGYAASSQEECHVAASHSWQAAPHGVPALSAELQAWLTRHNLAGVHECDQNGWTVLHHVARDSRTEVAAEVIFEELCKHVSPDQLDAVTGEAPESEHLPQGWTALHLLASGRGMQRGRMAERLLELKANPMPLTARGATPLHTAAATGNHEVAQVLLLIPGVNVNLKNKDNKTPYDVATSNRTMLSLVANAGGLPSPNLTGASSRDEPNARPRGEGASEARRKRAADWRNRR